MEGILCRRYDLNQLNAVWSRCQHRVWSGQLKLCGLQCQQVHFLHFFSPRRRFFTNLASELYQNQTAYPYLMIKTMGKACQHADNNLTNWAKDAGRLIENTHTHTNGGQWLVSCLVWYEHYLHLTVLCCLSYTALHHSLPLLCVHQPLKINMLLSGSVNSTAGSEWALLHRPESW